MKYLLPLFSSVLICISCFSQKTTEVEITDITKLTLLNPGLSYEKGVGKLQTLYGQVFMNISGGLGYSSSLGNTSSFYLDPAISLQYRYYYNARQRLEKGKRTEMNSLNYIGPIWQTVFSKSQDIVFHTIAATWGFQRNYKSRFSLDLQLGAGYVFSKNTGEFTSVSKLSLGFWLNKRK